MGFNIWTDYPRVPITQLLEFIVDNRGKTVPTAPSGHKLIATNCVTNNTLFPLYEKVRYLSDETYRTWFRSHPIPGDILFVNKGTPGRVCMVPDPIDFCIAQDMIALRADDSKIYNKYLFTVLRSHEIQQQIYNTNVGDVIPHFKKQFMDQLLIPVPDRKVQEAIGDLYYALSYKVEHNKKINDNLQQQLHLLFIQIFNGISEDVVLGDVVETTSGGTPSRKHTEYYENSSICWVKSKELLGNYILDTEEHINDMALSKSSAKLLPMHSVLIAMYGATVGAYGIISKSMTCNQAVCALLCNEKYPYTYLFQIAQEQQQKLINMAVGSAQQNISQVLIKQLPLHSDIAAIRKFHNLALPLHKQIEKLQAENRTLSEMRDTLLPQLMSGKLDVSDIEL